MQNSMLVFTFSNLDQKFLFGVNLVRKIRIFSLIWNLVAGLIRICRIQCWFSLFLFLTGNTLWTGLVPKLRIVFWKWNLVPRIIRICRIQWWCSLFLFSTGSIFFLRNMFHKIKIVCWSWNLEPRLIQIFRIRWWFSFFF